MLQCCSSTFTFQTGVKTQKGAKGLTELLLGTKGALFGSRAELQGLTSFGLHNFCVFIHTLKVLSYLETAKQLCPGPEDESGFSVLFVNNRNALRDIFLWSDRNLGQSLGNL